MGRPSAHAVLRWTARTFGDDAAMRIFEPLIADWQRQWRTERRTFAGRTAAAVRGGFAFASTCLTVGWQTGRHLPARVRVTAFATAIGFTSLGAGAVVLGFLHQLDTMRGAALAAMAPSLFAVAGPLALLPAAAVLARTSREARPAHTRWFLVRFVAGTMCVMGIALAYVVPATNQHFRRVMASQVAGRDVVPPRGPRELSAVELVLFDDTREVFVAGTREHVGEELALRATIAMVWPVAFACFGWRLAGARQTISTRAVLGWWVLALVTTLFVSGGERQTREQLGVFTVVIPAVLWIAAALMLRPPSAAAESRR